MGVGISSDCALHKLRMALIGTAVVLGAFALVFIQEYPTFTLSSFGSFAGSLITIGEIGGRTVTHISFDAGETSETLLVSNLNIIFTPDAPDISHGALLSDALTSGKRVFGYKYASRNATQEIAAQQRAVLGEPITFSELFPGQFFASDEARGDSSFITDFEAQKNISFLPLSEVTLERNARYVMVTEDAAAALQVRGVNQRATIRAFPTYVWQNNYWIASTTGRKIDTNDAALLIDDPIENITAADFIKTAGTRPSDSALYIDFSRLPSNMSRIVGVTLHLDGERGSWGRTGVAAHLVRSGDRTPLTVASVLQPLPSHSEPGQHTALSLTALPNNLLTGWASSTLVISLSCTRMPCTPPENVDIKFTALSLEVTAECDGVCESVIAACPNGILERYADEVCDDGDEEDENKCSNTCALTHNWWIEELGTVGPFRTLGTDKAEGEVFVESPDAGFVLWYEGPFNAWTAFESLFISYFERSSGWSIPQRLNSMDVGHAQTPQAFNGVIQKPRFFRDSTGDVSLFFHDGAQFGGHLVRTTYDSSLGTWVDPVRVSDQIYEYYETSQMNGEKGLLLLTLPLHEPDHLGTYFDFGLYALTYSNDTWSDPVFVLKYEDTVQGQQRIAAARAAVGNDIARIKSYLDTVNGPPTEAARILGVSGAEYTVSWYGTSTVVVVP